MNVRANSQNKNIRLKLKLILRRLSLYFDSKFIGKKLFANKLRIKITKRNIKTMSFEFKKILEHAMNR